MNPPERIEKSIDRAQWESSECLEKKTRRSRSGSSTVNHYHLCHPCLQRIADPKHNEPCFSAPRRCPSMKDGEPTAAQVTEEFLQTVKPTKKISIENISDTMDLLMTSCSRCWDCAECKYWEAPRGSYVEAFATSHGASWIGESICYFCTYFIIRKCFFSDNEKLATYTIMSKLTDFLHAKKIVSAEDKKEIKKTLTRCRSVKSKKIDQALQKLFDEGYWKSLDLMNDAIDGDELDWNAVYSCAGDEMPMILKEVKNDGWIFEGSWDDERDYFVPLPEDVAKLGKEGIQFSCMNLQRFHPDGVWSPYNSYDESSVFANVYP